MESCLSRKQLRSLKLPGCSDPIQNPDEITSSMVAARCRSSSPDSHTVVATQCHAPCLQRLLCLTQRNVPLRSMLASHGLAPSAPAGRVRRVRAHGGFPDNHHRFVLVACRTAAGLPLRMHDAQCSWCLMRCAQNACRRVRHPSGVSFLVRHRRAHIELP